MEKKFSIFRKNNFEAFGKVSPLCGSVSVCVKGKWGWVIKWGAVFNLARVWCIWYTLYGEWWCMSVQTKRMVPLLIPSFLFAIKDHSIILQLPY